MYKTVNSTLSLFIVIFISLILKAILSTSKINIFFYNNYTFLFCLIVLLIGKEIYTEIIIKKNPKEILKNNLYKFLFILIIFSKNFISFISIIIGLIFLFLFFIILVYIHSYPEKKEESLLFKSRHEVYETLREYMENKKIKSILIAGEWGEGKTYFVDYFLKQNTQYIPIKIKSSLYRDKIEIRNFFFQELKTILLNNNIGNIAINEVIKKFDKLEGKLVLSFFSNEFTLEENMNSIKELFKLIKEKNILIILDDLERVFSDELKLEIISFISEVEEFLDFRLLILMNYEKVKIHYDYLQKYIDARIDIPKLTTKELLEYLLDDSEKIKNIEDSIQYYSTPSYDDKFFSDKFSNSDKKSLKNRINSKIINIYSIINTPRFLNRLVINFENNKIQNFYNNQNKETKKCIIDIFVLCYVLKEHFYTEYLKIKKNENYFQNLYVFHHETLDENNDENRILHYILIKISKNIFSGELTRILSDFIREKELMTTEEINTKYTITIIEEFKNPNIIPNKNYKQISEIYNHIKITKNLISRDVYKDFINNYYEYLKISFKKRNIDSLEFVKLFLQDEIFKNITDFPLIEENKNFWFKEETLKNLSFYFKDVDFKLIQSDFWYFSYIFDYINIYDFDITNNPPFSFSHIYLSFYYKDNDSALLKENPLRGLMELVKIKQNEKNIPQIKSEKTIKYFELLLNLYKEGNKQKSLLLKDTNKYPEILKVVNDSDLFNGTKEGIYTEEELLKNEEELIEKFKNEYLIKNCIFLASKKNS